MLEFDSKKRGQYLSGLPRMCYYRYLISLSGFKIVSCILWKKSSWRYVGPYIFCIASRWSAIIPTVELVLELLSLTVLVSLRSLRVCSLDASGNMGYYL